MKLIYPNKEVKYDWWFYRNLNNEDLEGFTICGSEVISCYLKNANLKDIKVTGSILRYTRFDGADLTNGYFKDCTLKGSSFKGAKIDGLVLEDVNDAVLLKTKIAALKFKNKIQKNLKYLKKYRSK